MIVLLLYALVLAVVFVKQRDWLYQPVAFSGAPGADGPPIQVVGIHTSDGERLVGWYLPPKGGRPTLLFFNGQGGGLGWQGERWRRIAVEGGGFLAIGYRGHDGSTGRPSEDGLRLDALAAYDWLATRTKASDIVIHGFSLGTGVAVGLATQRPARAVVLEAPYTAVVDIAAKAYPWMPVRLLMLDQFQSRDLIPDVRAPVLIVHGSNDTSIPFSHGQALYDLAPPPKRLVEMIGSGHNTLTQDGVYAEIWRFIGLEATSAARKENPVQVVIREQISAQAALPT